MRSTLLRFAFQILEPDRLDKMLLEARFIQVTDLNFTVPIGRRMNEFIVADIDTDNACGTMIMKENQVPFLQIRPVDTFSQP